MTESETRLAIALRDAHAHAEGDAAPDFSRVWDAARARAAAIRNRRRLFAASGAAAAVLAIVFGLRVPSDDEWRYINADELLEKTGWSAPSDSLLPDREFDIYRDIPVLIESTDNYGGALL